MCQRAPTASPLQSPQQWGPPPPLPTRGSPELTRQNQINTTGLRKQTKLNWKVRLWRQQEDCTLRPDETGITNTKGISWCSHAGVMLFCAPHCTISSKFQAGVSFNCLASAYGCLYKYTCHLDWWELSKRVWEGCCCCIILKSAGNIPRTSASEGASSPARCFLIESTMSSKGILLIEVPLNMQVPLEIENLFKV